PEPGGRGAGEPGRPEADDDHHEHAGARRHLREREGVDELPVRDPAVDVDRLPLHLGEDAEAASEGEEAEPAEDPGEGAQLREVRHARRRKAGARAGGRAASSTQWIGQWSRPNSTNVNAAIP